MTEVSRRRAQTRERLLDAAALAFADKGVTGASVEEICEGAGFTRGAFYSNFDSKEDLCLALLQRNADVGLAATQKALAALPGPGALASLDLDDVVAGAVRAFMVAHPADRTTLLAGAALRLHAAREESLRPAYLEFLTVTHATFGRLLEDAAGALGYRLTLPGARVTALLHGVFEHLCVEALLDDSKATPDAAVLTQILRALLVKA